MIFCGETNAKFTLDSTVKKAYFDLLFFHRAGARAQF